MEKFLQIFLHLILLKNTKEFKYLGLMTSMTDQKKFLQHRISSASAKFSSLKKLLTDRRIEMSTRLKFLNSFVRSRLTYSAATWDLKEQEVAQLEAVWCRFLRRLIPGGFRRRPDFGLVHSNEVIYKCTNAQPIRTYLRKQQFR